MMLFKIFRAGEWATLCETGETAGAPVDLADGYIHFSTSGQVAETAAKHFAGVEGLVLAWCDGESLGEALTWEPSRGGALFPHLYRLLHRADIAGHAALPLGPDGAHVFPDPLPWA